DYADAFVGRKIQPFRIEDEARKLTNTNFIVGPRFSPHAVRDGILITGQQQYSGAAAARLVIEALGVWGVSRCSRWSIPDEALNISFTSGRSRAPLHRRAPVTRGRASLVPSGRPPR